MGTGCGRQARLAPCRKLLQRHIPSTLVTLSHPATHLTVVVTTFPPLGDEPSCARTACQELPPGPRLASQNKVGARPCLKSHAQGSVPFRFLLPFTMYVLCPVRLYSVHSGPSMREATGAKSSRARGWRKRGRWLINSGGHQENPRSCQEQCRSVTGQLLPPRLKCLPATLGAGVLG